MKFIYENLNFRSAPLPFGLAKPLMDESLYQELLWMLIRTSTCSKAMNCMESPAIDIH